MKPTLSKTVIVLSLVAVLAAGLAPLLADAPSPTPTPAATQTPSTAPTPVAPPKPAAQPIKGKVTALDATAHTFSILKKKKSSDFTFTDSTAFTIGKAHASATDLTVGAKVTVTYGVTADGKFVATAVSIGKKK